MGTDRDRRVYADVITLISEGGDGPGAESGSSRHPHERPPVWVAPTS
jgi:hypothetical protein